MLGYCAPTSIGFSVGLTKSWVFFGIVTGLFTRNSMNSEDNDPAH
jgi:hypothetical protein